MQIILTRNDGNGSWATTEVNMAQYSKLQSKCEMFHQDLTVKNTRFLMGRSRCIHIPERYLKNMSLIIVVNTTYWTII
jgi:hypothetical protein